MSIKQPVKGRKVKDNDLINNFIKGYNTRTVDDVLEDNTMRDMLNVTIDDKGALSKRRGCANTKLTELLEKCIEGSPELNLTVTGYISLLNNLQNPTLLTEGDNEKVKILYDDIFGINNIKDENNNKRLMSFNVLTDELEYPSRYELKQKLSYVMIFGGKNTSLEYHLFKYARLDIDMYIPDIRQNNVDIIINFHIVKPEDNVAKDYIDKKLYDEKIINIANYNNYLIFVTGKDIYQAERNDFKSFKSLTINPYKPTPIEVSNIGFNLLADNPIEYVDTLSGNADSIKGYYFTYENEPIQLVPYNKPFKINILATGSTTLGKPQYRPDTGETDETKNPYKDFSGSYEGSIFKVTGFDQDGKYQMRIKKGETITPFYAYFNCGNVEDRTVGKIEDTSKLIKSSTKCKVIGNQLVLYGNHGYTFFSDYDKFNYFPNYFYVYAVETIDDEVVGIHYFRQFYAIFTKRLIKRMSGIFGGQDFGIYPLNNFVGCINGNTIKQIQNNLVFLSDNGLYMLKQGYIGEGTENVVQIDNNIVGDYNPKNVISAVVSKNRYILNLSNSKMDSIVYDADMDAFYKYKYAKSFNIESDNVEPYRYYSPLFTNYAFGENQLLAYQDSETKILQLLDFESGANPDNIHYSDDNEAYNSLFESIKINFGTPIHNKKFKKLFIKGINNGGNRIPFYVTISVDDNIYLHPDYYNIYIDEEDYIRYELKPKSDLGLENGAILGDLTLGYDALGERKQQTVKLNLGAKGKSISIKIEDNFNKDLPNKEHFMITALSFINKLKKPKEDIKWRGI